MGTTWILVANASRASLYENHGPKSGLKKIKSFEHRESREKASTLVSDRPGHGPGAKKGAYVPASDPKENEAHVFAHELTHELDHGRKTNQYHRLILVAPPQFMGLINNHAGAGLKNMVSDQFDKDYTAIEPAKLAKHLEGCLYL